jgi:hypothetical protein
MRLTPMSRMRESAELLFHAVDFTVSTKECLEPLTAEATGPKPLITARLKNASLGAACSCIASLLRGCRRANGRCEKMTRDVVVVADSQAAVICWLKEWITIFLLYSCHANDEVSMTYRDASVTGPRSMKTPDTTTRQGAAKEQGERATS